MEQKHVSRDVADYANFEPFQISQEREAQLVECVIKELKTLDLGLNDVYDKKGMRSRYSPPKSFLYKGESCVRSLAKKVVSKILSEIITLIQEKRREDLSRKKCASRTK